MIFLKPMSPKRETGKSSDSGNKADRQWKERLLLRSYRFPASGESDRDFSARIDHGGVGYFFPLGTSDMDAAAHKAREIYETVVKRGWPIARQRFSCELIVSFEWSMNPVLWTYTTIHTLVQKQTGAEPGTSADGNRQRVLVFEADPGICRALSWSINQQPGLLSVPCDSTEAFSRMINLHKPSLVLSNRNMAGRLRIETTGALTQISPGVPVLTYSVHVDGDQMFVSTPGGSQGYVVKRVKPTRLLDPILNAAGQPDFSSDNLQERVRFYFRSLLQTHSDQSAFALAKLTSRERDVLDLLSKGYVNKEIAQTLGISLWTVHGHIKNIFERLHVRTRTEAVVRYLEK
jgi:DNA-binding NarL/FixJ family response regulator